MLDEVVRSRAVDTEGDRVALAAGDTDTVVVMRVAPPTLVWRARHGTVHFSGSGDPFGFPDEEREALALAIAWRADGALVSVGEGSEATVWDAATGTAIETHEVDGWTQTTAIAASSSGWFITGDARGGVRLFVPGSRAPVDQAQVAEAVAAIELVAGDRAAIIGADGSRQFLRVDAGRLVGST